jgi:glycosyltransferase AglD
MSQKFLLKKDWQEQLSGLRHMKNRYVIFIARTISIVLVALFISLTYRYFDGKKLLYHFSLMIKQPGKLLLMAAVYGTSFWLRAIAWKWYVQKNIHLRVYMNGLFLSLFVNHLVPVKVGDLIRIGVLAKQPNVSADEAFHSVAALRMLDMLVLLIFSLFGVYFYFETFSLKNFLSILLGACAIGISFVVLLVKWKPSFAQKHLNMARQAWTGPAAYKIVGSVFLSWLCEAIVVLEVAKMSGLSLSILEAIWVNSLTVAGQMFQIAPGGLATYEAVMAFALTKIHPSWDKAYTIAVLSHAFKFIFSYAVGVLVLLKNPREVLLVRSLLKKKEVSER